MIAAVLRSILRHIGTMRQRADFRKRDIVIARGSTVQSGVKIGDHTRINRPSFLTSCQIGRHCAIAGPLTVRSTNHNIFALALQAHTQRDLVGSRKANHGFQRSGVFVGDNVWIGDSVILLDGATIGHSSIVAAGSVVNKAFPPFSILGGVPARLIRMRFPDEKIEILSKLNWWTWDVEKLKRNSFIFEIDLEGVTVQELAEAVSRIRS